MAKVYFKMYKEDGQAISNGDNSNPLSVILNATNNETKTMKTTLKSEAGYKLATGTVVRIGTGLFDSYTPATKYQISLQENEGFATEITIGSEVDETTGVVVYVKAMSSSDEDPSKDIETKIMVKATVQAI